MSPPFSPSTHARQASCSHMIGRHSSKIARLQRTTERQHLFFYYSTDAVTGHRYSNAADSWLSSVRQPRRDVCSNGSIDRFKPRNAAEQSITAADRGNLLPLDAHHLRRSLLPPPLLLTMTLVSSHVRHKGRVPHHSSFQCMYA